jgi:membrane fusion protein, multidrug efflux system
MNTAFHARVPTASRTAALAALAAAASLLTACSRPEPAPEPIRAVRTLTVASESAGGVHEFAAEVKARTESRLGFRVGGKLIARPSEVGQRVKAGQVLAQIDGTDLKLGGEAAQAAVRAARTQLDLAAADLKRYQELRAQGFISAVELDRRETTFKAQQAQHEQAVAQARVQGNQAGYAALTATASGVVTGTDAEVGTVLAAGAPVIRLAHDGPRDAVFAVPEDGVAAMRALMGKEGALKVRPWGQTVALAATVREVAAAADAATRTFLVKADIGNAPLQLGQTVTALVDLPKREGIARLPLSAVMNQQGKTAVWLLDRSTMTVKVQAIAVGGADGNSVIVAGGLSPGQTVVTAGVHVLTPGQKVKLYDAGIPTAGAPAATAATAASPTGANPNTATR